jgi:uncharacterized protein
MNTSHYLSPRVFKINVGFLLSAPLGTSQDSTFDFPEVHVSDDLSLYYLRGPIRISRTKEGILVQATLHAGLQSECYRCLDPVTMDSVFEIEELFTPVGSPFSEFHVNDDAALDLAPLVRAEVLMNTDERVLCRPDCKGLCPECGANRNHVACTCAENQIDPRLAALRKLLDSK